MPSQPAPFVAHPNRRGSVVFAAAMAPLITAIGTALVFHPASPTVLRVIAALILLPPLLGVVTNLRLALQRRPYLVIDAEGLRWSRWSERVIPWEAVERWQRRHFILSNYVTLWLVDPAAHAPGLFQRFISWCNRWLGFGHVTLSGGGMDRSFDELCQAFADFAPKPPLPDDPRLARRLLAAREKQERRRFPQG